MRYLYITTLLFFSGVTAFSQQVVVLDKSNLQPIAQVTISNTDLSSAVVTNLKGEADLSIFKSDETLFFNHVSFQPYVVSVKDLETPEATVYLIEHVIKLDELVVSANRMPEKKSEVPYQIETINSREIQFNNPQTAALMLEQTGEVFVQQSQMGGGSPVLRGLEANRVLLVVDGVRMNNAIYRGGHLQSIITVDPNLLKSTEVLFGPGSVIYGSDALGGVISMQTFDPVCSQDGSALISGQAMGRFASANTEKTGGFRINIGLKKWAFLTAVSYSDFGDLREGRTRNPFYGTFGERPYYAERIDGRDTMMVNDKPWIQKPSGYSQYSVVEKVLFKPKKGVDFMFNLQYSNSSDIPRYDRLTNMSDGHLKYAEWYYGPQERLLASFKASFTNKTAIYDEATFILAFQRSKEMRASRKFGSTAKSVNDDAVDMYTLTGDLSKRLNSKDILRYGFSADFNRVSSEAWQEDITTGQISYDIATRYPNKKAEMTSVAAFVSNEWNLNRLLTFTQGLRFTHVGLSAAWTDSVMAIMQFPFNSSVSQSSSALNGYLGWVLHTEDQWKISLLGSSGFRAPNIDDMGKVNDSNAEDHLIIVPNPDLKPEYAYNLELSVAKTFANSIRLEVTGYRTWLTDAIVLRPYSLNGQDSITYDGELCQVQANTNAQQATIYGLQGRLLAQVTPSFSIVSDLTYTYGRVKDDDAPLDHIPPVYGKTSFKLEQKRFRGDFYVMYNGWKRIADYSPSGEDNQAYATAEGMPAWMTLNLKLSYQLTRVLNLEAGVENMLDQNYRKFASGISSPGRNVLITLRANF